MLMYINRLRYMMLCLEIFAFLPVMAQESEVVELEHNVAEGSDSTAVVRVVDSLKNVKPDPVHSVRTLGVVSVIDTLPTENEALRIVLFNDNTWRYVLSENYKQDANVFSDHWNVESTHAYNDVEISSLPETVALQLVDSLKSYHHPFKGRISSRYGLRRGRPHQGVDLPLKVGDPVYATFDGKVRLSKVAGNYGNLVIRHTMLTSHHAVWRLVSGLLLVSRLAWVVVREEALARTSTMRLDIVDSRLIQSVL